MHVADFKACTVTGQTARPQSRQTALMRNFRQRVILIHKLRQLRRTEEFADNRRNRLGIDQILRFNVIQRFGAHSFANGAFHTQQSHTILIFHQFADRTDTTVAEVVNIVNFPFAVTQFNQTLDNTQNIIFTQRAVSIRRIFKRNVQSNIHLHTTDRRQVITVIVKEQRTEQLISRFIGRRFTRTHNAIDIQQSFFAVMVFVCFQRIADIRADINVVNVKNLDFADFCRRNIGQNFFIQFSTGICNNFTGFRIDDCSRQKFAKQLIRADFIEFQPFIGQFLSRTRRQFFAFFPNGFTGFGINQVEIKFNAFHTLRQEFDFPGLFVGNISVNIIEIAQNFFFIHSFDFGRIDFFALSFQFFDFVFGFFGIQRIQNGSNRQLAATVDAGINQIFGIKFKIEPGTAIRNNAGRKQIFTGSNGLAFVMIKEHTRRTVHL